MNGENYSLSNEVLSRVDIVELISGYVHLTKKGANYDGLCPFHNDRNPSMKVNQAKQIFKCFSCGIGGNAIKFLSLAEKMSYRDALYSLADKVGVEYKRGDADYNAKNKLRQDILSLNKNAARFFHESLNRSEKAIAYINERKIAPDIVRRFGLGYAPDSWKALMEHFTGQGVSHELLLQAGLITASSKNGETRYYDRFVDRLMFPIFDDLGNVIGFGGRIMEKNDKMAKYINSAETPVYFKGNSLYGLNFAKKSGKESVILVEGYMDCLALHQKGITNAVASLGTALTKKQAALLKKYFTEVIVAYDADEAGKKATLRGMDILKEANFKVKVFRLQGAKDADEYLKGHSADDFLKQLSRAKPLTEYKIALLASEVPPGSNENTIQFIRRANRILSANEIEREVYADWIMKEYGEAYGLKEHMFRHVTGEPEADSPAYGEDEFKQIRVPLSPEQQEKARIEEEKKTDFNEKTLLLILSEDMLCLKRLEPELRKLSLSIPENREALEMLLEAGRNGECPGSAALMHGDREDSAYAGILINFMLPTDSLKACRELIKKLKNQEKEKRKREITTLLDSGTADRETQEALLRELKALSGRNNN